MTTRFIFLSLLCMSIGAAAQNHHHQTPTTPTHTEDSTDVFYQHLTLGEVVVTGVTGDTKLKHSTAPISLVSAKDLRAVVSTNVIDAVAHQPGVAQVTTGSGISKPIIRGLGYNRIVVMNEGVRQEGQQWGDEHGIEIDGHTVSSVEILKGPASLMYGSDAMAGVMIMHSQPTLPEGEIQANIATEYQTNNGLIDYSLNARGNQGGFVWDARFTDRYAHAYKNKVDGYVPGTQFAERSGRLMMGLQRQWGQSQLTATYFHQTPSIAEGERDSLTGQLCRPEGFSSHSYARTLPFQQVRHFKAVWNNSLNLKHGQLKAIVGYQQNRRQEFEESDDDYELYFRLHTLTYDLRYRSDELPCGFLLSGGLGGMWQQSDNLGEETLIPAYHLWDIGAFATASKQFESLTLNGGLRIDNRLLNYHLAPTAQSEGAASQYEEAHSPRYTALTGSLGAVWNVCRHTNLRLNLARGFRAPNMSELGSDGVHEGTIRYEIGNPDLKAEASWQLDLGVDFTTSIATMQAALFANRIDNYIFAGRIDQVIDPDYHTYRYTQGDARLMGFEVGLDLHPIHALHFANNFSMVDARLIHALPATDDGTQSVKPYLPLIPAPRWQSELKYEFTHNGRHLLNNAYAAVAMELHLAQNHYYAIDDTETRTPSYTLLSLSAGADLCIRRKKVAELYITADNLLNRTYQSHLSRLKYADVNPLTGRRGVSNMGRNVIMKVVIPITLRKMKNT